MLGKLERLYLESQGELREIGSKIKVYKTKINNEIQMLEKQEGLKRDYQENMMYHQMIVRNIRQQEEVEIQKRRAEFENL